MLAPSIVESSNLQALKAVLTAPLHQLPHCVRFALKATRDQGI